MPVYSVQTTASHEATVADMVLEREYEEIHAALAPEAVTSYVMIEADNKAIIERAIEDIPHARKVLEGTTSLSEIEHFFETRSDVEGVSEGDVVHITDGPYQGEKAQVQNVDEGKEKVTVELYEATVPIPVTMRGDQIRVLDSDEWEEAKDS